MYIMKTEHLILYGKIFAVCSAVHTKHINTLRGKTVEIVTAILTDIFSILSLCYSWKSVIAPYLFIFINNRKEYNL